MRKFCTKMMACVIGTSLLFSTPAYAATAQWSSNNAYTAGSQVSFNGDTYEAQWWTQGEEPGSAEWGAWKKLESGNSGNTDGSTDSGNNGNGGSTDSGNAGETEKNIPKWDESTVYTGGKQAVYNNTIYEAKWWVQGERPDQSAAWKEIGPAGEITEPEVPTETEEPEVPTETEEPEVPTETEEPEVNEAPVFTGVQAKITLTVGDKFDALSGITASDKEDGDLTKSIIVTGTVNTAKAGTYQLVYTVADSRGLTASAASTVLVKAAEVITPPSTDKTEPPYPFWKDYKNYPTKDTLIYYKGKIYSNKWYANAGVKPDSGDPWVLIGDAEWTVTEDEKNYQKEENAAGNEMNKILSDAEIQTLYGGINPEYSPEAALGRLAELIPESSYEELFPYRFGSDGWKSCPATKMYYPNADELPDYYSYENLQEALHTLANTIIKVQWYEGAEWCYRIIRLNKSTKEQKLVYCDPSFEEEWIVTGKVLCTSVCDYGSFLAEGDLNTRKRELAGFLANISHETGGGTIDGLVDESLSGLYFNEEVGFIGSSAIGYVQGSGTAYLPVAGKSYHGRGPIQLSYNYNYGLCSDVLYGDSSILLNDPDKLEKDGVLGFMTGIWFWMTPQPPKPSCHQVITGVWEPKAGGANEKYNGNFGLTIVIINNEAGQSETGTGAVARRAKYYRIFAGKMGADITGEHCDTVGMTTFVQQSVAQ